jgi:hypothetical protein
VTKASTPIAAIRLLLSKSGFVGAIACAAGCSQTPARYYPPKYDASAIGARAVSALDRDGNQLLDAKELAASPALLADLKKLDSDNDRCLSAAEIGAKVADWTQGGVGAVAIVCAVTRGGQPVPDVHVKFIPETYIGDLVKSGNGVTDSRGGAAITAEGQKITGIMQCGYYRVELSSPKDGKETIPAKFNRETVLGADVRPNLEVTLAFDITK